MREVDVYPAGVRDARTTGKLAEPNPNTGRQDRRSAGLAGVEKSTETGEVASLRKKIRELEKQRVGWKKAEREFEAQILARSSETDRISAKVLLLERELAMAAMAASAVGNSFWNERKAWLGAVGAAAVVGLIFLCVAAWRGGSRAPLASSRPSISTTYPASTTHPAAIAAPGRRAQREMELPPDPSAAMEMAFDHLNGALESRGGRPADMLRRASENEQRCLVIWNGGSPAFVFGRHAERANSLAYTLEDCAEAVMNLH